MFDVIPYWMWVVSLIALAVMCGAVLSFGDSARRAVPRARRNHHSPRRFR
ncbi:conserved hypothetical protein [Paraburkholderia sabiae]|nr:hypothetical protein [Paraburkholderia sabiae]CAG9223150.1 conserved hypothetical protein [Paraburkholderia sabiae]